MTVLRRLALFVILQFLLLQLRTVRCEEQKEVKKQLRVVDKLEGKIGEIADKHWHKASNLRSVPDQIQQMPDVNAIKDAVERTLRTIRRNIRKGREDARSSLCSGVQTLKKFLKSTAPDTALTDFANSSEFLELLDAELLKNHDNLSKPGKHPLDRDLRVKESPSNLIGWKRYAKWKLDEAGDKYINEMEFVRDGALKDLHTVYNAMVVWKDIPVNMKDGAPRPKETSEKEALIKQALGLYEELKCAERKKEDKSKG